MKHFLVDSNVILDVFTEDSQWFGWSADKLKACADEGCLHINPIIYAEISMRFSDIAELEESLKHHLRFFQYTQLPKESLFLAGKAYLSYKKNKGKRKNILSDFYIGAHAAVSELSLLTRDARKYQYYFPSLKLIQPKESILH